MSTLEFLVTLEKDEDGYIVAECPSLPGCVSQGNNVEEALANIQDAIEGILRLRREKGLSIPAVEVAKVEVSG
jgi:predicted RNase H-like HicB family nuclease